MEGGVGGIDGGMEGGEMEEGKDENRSIRAARRANVDLTIPESSARLAIKVRLAQVITLS